MMKNAGLFLAGVSVTSGIGAGLFLAANLVVWAMLAAWVGSAAAFIGFGMIAWALNPAKQYQELADGARFEKGEATLAEVA